MLEAIDWNNVILWFRITIPIFWKSVQNITHITFKVRFYLKWFQKHLYDINWIFDRPEFSHTPLQFKSWPRAPVNTRLSSLSIVGGMECCTILSIYERTQIPIYSPNLDEIIIRRLFLGICTNGNVSNWGFVL